MLKSLGGMAKLGGISVLVLGLVVGLAPAVQAAAPAIDNSASAIIVYAPGAPLGSPVAVQFMDSAGNWLNVAGWTGTLDRETDNLLVPYKEFTVFKANYGQGPFRWEVFSLNGNSVWGTSDSFTTPPGGGIIGDETIVPGVTGLMAGMTAPAPVVTPAPSTAAAVASVPVITSMLMTNTGNASFPLSCSDCSAISGYFLGFPANSWITVEWGNGPGRYEAIQGWQGTADTTDTATGQLIKHFAIFAPNLGQGPFRWAIYSQPGGTLLGSSPDFTLPAQSGVNSFMSFSK